MVVDRGLRPKLWQLDPWAGGLGREGGRSEKLPEVGVKDLNIYDTPRGETRPIRDGTLRAEGRRGP